MQVGGLCNRKYSINLFGEEACFIDMAKNNEVCNCMKRPSSHEKFMISIPKAAIYGAFF